MRMYSAHKNYEVFAPEKRYDSDKVRQKQHLFAGISITKMYKLQRKSSEICAFLVSLPLRERGLKYTPEVMAVYTMLVAPSQGAWIEIEYVSLSARLPLSRSLSGSVD